MESRRIAILGSGNVGRTLGTGLLLHGHQVVLGTRDPSQQRVKEWLAEAGEGSRVATYSDAAEWAEYVFVCVPGSVAEETAQGVREEIAGKVVIDVTNRITSQDGTLTLSGALADSVAARIQRAAPEARVVKAFNTVGFRLMVDPDLPCGPPTMFVAADDAEAREAVSELARSLGWEVAVLGGLASAPLLEALGAAWVQYGRINGTEPHAFKMLRT